MIRTQVLLTPDLYEAIKLRAKTEDLSFSAIVRSLLSKLVLKKKKTSGEMLKEIAEKCAFSDPNLPKDLATNDEYIYGKKAHYGTR